MTLDLLSTTEGLNTTLTTAHQYFSEVGESIEHWETGDEYTFELLEDLHLVISCLADRVEENLQLHRREHDNG